MEEDEEVDAGEENAMDADDEDQDDAEEDGDSDGEDDYESEELKDMRRMLKLQQKMGYSKKDLDATKAKILQLEQKQGKKSKQACKVSRIHLRLQKPSLPST